MENSRYFLYFYYITTSFNLSYKSILEMENSRYFLYFYYITTSFNLSCKLILEMENSRYFLYFYYIVTFTTLLNFYYTVIVMGPSPDWGCGTPIFELGTDFQPDVSTTTL